MILTTYIKKRKFLTLIIGLLPNIPSKTSTLIKYNNMEPFTVNIPESVITDLKNRLQNVRWRRT